MARFLYVTSAPVQCRSDNSMLSANGGGRRFLAKYGDEEMFSVSQSINHIENIVIDPNLVSVPPNSKPQETIRRSEGSGSDRRA